MPNVKKIMAPIEFYEYSDQVILWAVKAARLFGAELSFLHVNSNLDGTPSMVAGSIHSPARTEEDIKKVVAKYIPNELIVSVNISYHIRRGDTVEEILNFAKSNDTDLIIIGKTRKSAFARFFSPDIEESVIYNAPCHVLLINLKEK